MIQNIPGIFQLTDQKTISSGSGFQTKKIAERTQILSGKLKIELASKAVKKRRVVSSNDNIINIQEQINNVRLLMKDKKRGVYMAATKPKGEKKRVETLKPDTRSLFEAIKSFLQLIDMIRVSGINVPIRLFYIDIFSESAIEECILHIKLAERPSVGNSKREHNMNSSSLNNRTESVNVIKTRYLSIAFGHKTSLEAINGPIKQIFCSEHPFETDNICVGRSRN